MIQATFIVWSILIFLITGFSLLMVWQKKWVNFFYGLCLLELINLAITNGIKSRRIFPEHFASIIQVLIIMIIIAYLLQYIFKTKKQLD